MTGKQIETINKIASRAVKEVWPNGLELDLHTMRRKIEEYHAFTAINLEMFLKLPSFKFAHAILKIDEEITFPEN